MIRDRRRRRVYYGSRYKGRSTANEKLKVVAAVLLVLVLLAGLGMWLGQRFFVYTDDGLRLNLPKITLPLSREDEDKSAGLSDVSVHVDVSQPSVPAALSCPRSPPSPPPLPSLSGCGRSG